MRCLIVNLVLLVVSARSDDHDGMFFFNSKEIDTIQYEVKIGGDPILTSEQPKVYYCQLISLAVVSYTIFRQENSMTMRNKYGQKYRCLMPELLTQEEVTNEEDEAQETVEDGNSLSTENIKRLLKPLEDQPCLLYSRDWWTYELCYNNAVQQFHMEGDKRSEPVLILGVFDRDYDWSQYDSKQFKATKHSQYFTNGSICDVNGEQRKTEVRVKNI